MLIVTLRRLQRYHKKLMQRLSGKDDLIFKTVTTLEEQDLTDEDKTNIKKNIDMDNVDNTKDEDKPVSNAQQEALDKKANKSGDIFTGNIKIQHDNSSGINVTNTKTKKDIQLTSGADGNMGLDSNFFGRWLLYFKNGRMGANGHMPNALFLEHGSLVSVQSGTKGSTGWLNIANIEVIPGVWGNSPLIFEIAGKGWSYSRRLFVYISVLPNSSGPELAYFSIDNHPPEKIKIVRIRDLNWKIYVQKTDLYGEYCICSMHDSTNEGFFVSFPDSQEATIPNDVGIEPSVIRWAKAEDANTVDGKHASDLLNYNNLTNRPTIPTNTSQLTNNSGFVSQEKGVWTPAHGYSVSSGQFTLSEGTYIKMGNVVIANFTVSPGYIDGSHPVNLYTGSLPFTIDGKKFILAVLQEIYSGNKKDGTFAGAVNSIAFGEHSFEKSNPTVSTYYATIIYRV